MAVETGKVVDQDAEALLTGKVTIAQYWAKAYAEERVLAGAQVERALQMKRLQRHAARRDAQ